MQETARRAVSPAFTPPMVVCNNEHRFLIAEQLRAAGIDEARIVLEPVGRNSAPAIAAAAMLVAEQNPDTVLWIMAADSSIADEAALQSAVQAAGRAARDGQDRLFRHFRALTEGIKELKLHRERRRAFLEEDITSATDVCRSHSVAAERQRPACAASRKLWSCGACDERSALPSSFAAFAFFAPGACSLSARTTVCSSAGQDSGIVFRARPPS